MTPRRLALRGILSQFVWCVSFCLVFQIGFQYEFHKLGFGLILFFGFFCFSNGFLLLRSQILVLQRFRCFLRPRYWFYLGFVAFEVPNIGCTKVSLFCASQVLVLLRFRCFFASQILVLLRFRCFGGPKYWFY